jgi:large subunit ribosomal protein L22
MKVRAVSRNVGYPSRKMRLIVDMVRGKSVEEALTILKFTPKPAARAVAKTIKSAAANAENSFEMDPAGLKVAEIYADEGITLKRMRPQARGRVSPLLKRSTHITVYVSEEGK